MLELIDITKSFGHKTIFQHANYQFKPGIVYVIQGSSGCGKTTLLNMIAMLEKCDQGTIQLDGISYSKIKQQQFYQNKLGYVFQNYGLLENEDIQTNLKLAFIGKKISKSKQKEMMLEALKMVSLNLHLKQKIYTLSGGEAQRVALAKIFLKQPSIILADEPTASLDPDNGKEIMNILLSLRKPDRYIIIASHDPRVWQIGDELIQLQPYEPKNA